MSISERSPEEIVFWSVPCATCRYNLRGLRLSGNCPECNTSILENVHPQRLLFADPAWLRHLLSGAYWTAGLLILVVLLGAVLMTIRAIVSSSEVRILDFAEFLMSIGVPIAWVVVVRRATQPPLSGARLPRPAIRAALLARNAALLTCGCDLLSEGLRLMDTARFEGLGTSLARIYPLLGGASTIAVMLAYYGLFGWWHSLMQRIPAPGWAAALSRLGVAVMILFALSLLGTVWILCGDWVAPLGQAWMDLAEPLLLFTWFVPHLIVLVLGPLVGQQLWRVLAVAQRLRDELDGAEGHLTPAAPA
jgi:hypothetical protein